VLRLATKIETAAIAVALGASVGLTARGYDSGGWVFALLILSAAAVAIAQQTLP
jgi:uncharacterized membrane protein